VEHLVEINDSCYLDTESHVIAIQIDRVTFTLHVDEFLDFYSTMDDIKDFLMSSSGYVVGSTMADNESKKIIMPKPDENEYT